MTTPTKLKRLSYLDSTVCSHLVPSLLGLSMYVNIPFGTFRYLSCMSVSILEQF